MDGITKEAAQRVLDYGASYLSCAFVWDYTPQGHDFWEGQSEDGKLSPEGRAILEFVADDKPVAVAGSNGNAPKFKVGDRVRVVRRGDDDGGSFHSAKIGDEFTVTKIYDEPEAEIHTNVWYFYPHEIELVDAPLTLRAGRYYKTRDGRKVGPMRAAKDNETWEDVYGNKGAFVAEDMQRGSYGGMYAADGTWLTADDECNRHNLIAEWTDEPDAACDNDTIDDWYYGKASETTGFTVPLVAPEFANDNDEPDAKLLVSISADTSALDAEIDRILKRLRKLKRKAKKMGISLEYSELRDAA